MRSCQFAITLVLIIRANKRRFTEKSVMKTIRQPRVHKARARRDIRFSPARTAPYFTMEKSIFVTLVLQLVLSFAFVSGGRIKPANLLRLEKKEDNQVKRNQETSAARNVSKDVGIDFGKILDMNNLATRVHTIIANKLDEVDDERKETLSAMDSSRTSVQNSKSTGIKKFINNFVIINSSKIDSANGSATEVDSLIINSLKTRSQERNPSNVYKSSDTQGNENNQIDHKNDSVVITKVSSLPRNSSNTKNVNNSAGTDRESKKAISKEIKDDQDISRTLKNTSNHSDEINVKNRILQAAKNDEESDGKSINTDLSIKQLQQVLLDDRKNDGNGGEKMDESTRSECKKQATDDISTDCEETNVDEDLSIESTDEAINHQEDSAEKINKSENDETTSNIEITPIIDLLMKLIKNVNELKAENLKRSKIPESQRTDKENHDNDPFHAIRSSLGEETEFEDVSPDNILTDEIKDDRTTKGDIEIAVRLGSDDISNLPGNQTDKKPKKENSPKAEKLNGTIGETNKLNNSEVIDILKKKARDLSSTKLSDHSSRKNSTGKAEAQAKEREYVMDILLESINMIIGKNKTGTTSVAWEKTSKNNP